MGDLMVQGIGEGLGEFIRALLWLVIALPIVFTAIGFALAKWVF